MGDYVVKNVLTEIYAIKVNLTFMLSSLDNLQKGAFSVAAKTKAPVVPITLVGTGQIMPAGKEDIVNSGSVKVVIHKPMHGNDPMMLCEEARNTIESVLNFQD